MTVVSDLALPKVNVLDSTMAYRERLGNRAGISSGKPQSRVYPWACFHGVHPAYADVE